MCERHRDSNSITFRHNTKALVHFEQVRMSSKHDELKTPFFFVLRMFVAE